MLLAGFVALTVVMARCETEKEFFFKDNDSIVFLGDSITQQKLYTTYLEAYTLTRFPDRRFRFRNVGWGGDTAWLRKRFKTDANATAALTLAPVSEELNRYMLEVEGLKEASYSLSIDGLKAGDYSREQLAEGVNLATASTPNAAQAMQVLDLVFKKNNVYFERWRKCQLGNGPAEKLAELDKLIADFEAQIDTARKPRRQRFELKPL